MKMTRYLLHTCLLLVLAACGANQSAAPQEPNPAPEPPPAPSEPTAPPEHTMTWSDWAPDVSGELITVPAGETILLDISPAPLGELVIDGDLVFANSDLELTADSIMVHGSLHIGEAGVPFRQQAVITLTGERGPDTEHGMGDRYLVAMNGGRLELHGEEAGSWTLLTRDAHSGDTTITVEDASGWRVGDRIVIATTDYPTIGDDGLDVQTEPRTVTAIDGNYLKLDRPLDYFHVGSLMVVDGVTVDQRAEVARLSRNIIIQGPESTIDPGAADYGFGGHVMVMNGGSAHISGVEFRRMGQRGILARYPMHFHLVRGGGSGSYVRGAAIHDSFNRCLTLHGTDYVQVVNVVGYGAPGHCFFLEDGAERGNVLHGNLALTPRVPDDGFAILPSDSHPYFGPAGFWITNPDNDLVGNHAVGSPGTGIWYALPPEPTGDFAARFGDAGIRPRTTPLGLFEQNVVHSNHSTGLHVDNGFGADLEVEGATYYAPRTDPLDRDSEPVPAEFRDLDAWRNRDGGAWFRGEHAVLRGGLLSDNPVGVTFASNASWAEDVTFVGATPNPGTPEPWEPTGPNGESLPMPWQPDYLIHGFEFYDGDVAVRDSRFVAYESSPARPMAAISYLDYTAFEVSPLNSSSGLSFSAGTRRVFLETREPTVEYPADGYRSAVFTDEDGSLTGTAGTVVTVNNPFLLTPGCGYEADWNAWLCPPGTSYRALNLHAVGGAPSPFGTVTVSRSDGESHDLIGTPGVARYRSIVLHGDEYRLDWDGQAGHLQLSITEAQPGDELLVSLPYGSDRVFVYRDWNITRYGNVTGSGSLADLRAMPGPGFHLADGRLHVKLVVQDGQDYARFDICAVEFCA